MSETLAALDKIARAEQAVDDLCSGRLRWEMRVPAEPDHDPDLIISDALRAAREALTARGVRVGDEGLRAALPVLDWSYGKKPTYDVAGGCLTCGQRFTVRREKGVKPPLSVECPSCGCTEYGWRAATPTPPEIDELRLARALDRVEEAGVRRGDFDRLTSWSSEHLAADIATVYRNIR